MNWAEMKALFPWLPKTSMGYHQHPNGGGWVSDNSSVSDDSVIQDSLVDGGSFVDGGSLVVGGSLVDGGGLVDGGNITRTPLVLCGLPGRPGIEHSQGWVCFGCVLVKLTWKKARVVALGEEHEWNPEQIEMAWAWMRAVHEYQKHSPQGEYLTRPAGARRSNDVPVATALLRIDLGDLGND